MKIPGIKICIFLFISLLRMASAQVNFYTDPFYRFFINILPQWKYSPNKLFLDGYWIWYEDNIPKAEISLSIARNTTKVTVDQFKTLFTFLTKSNDASAQFIEQQSVNIGMYSAQRLVFLTQNARLKGEAVIALAGEQIITFNFQAYTNEFQSYRQKTGWEQLLKSAIIAPAVDLEIQPGDYKPWRKFWANPNIPPTAPPLILPPHLQLQRNKFIQFEMCPGIDATQILGLPSGDMWIFDVDMENGNRGWSSCEGIFFRKPLTDLLFDVKTQQSNNAAQRFQTMMDAQAFQHKVSQDEHYRRQKNSYRESAIQNQKWADQYKQEGRDDLSKQYERKAEEDRKKSKEADQQFRWGTPRTEQNFNTNSSPNAGTKPSTIQQDAYDTAFSLSELIAIKGLIGSSKITENDLHNTFPSLTEIQKKQILGFIGAAPIPAGSGIANLNFEKYFNLLKLNYMNK